MKLFRCDHCGNTLYFENVSCQNCGHRLGFEPEIGRLVSLDTDAVTWTSPSSPGRTYVFCANATHGACNWLVESDPNGSVFCRACRHNETIPPLDTPQLVAQWQTIERAKHRLFYTLLQFGLPLETRDENSRHGLAFRFLADIGEKPVMTGHDSGVITIAMAEADDAERERRRAGMGEPYRTLLGHFRHEIAHHYWDLLVSGTSSHEEFRTLFGDERIDYAKALERHYAEGAPADWQQTHISAYATAHPWEDFAETWAHYLHITDTIETAGAYGLMVRPEVDNSGQLTTAVRLAPHSQPSIAPLIDTWVPLASLLNNLNRSMGVGDAYPFVLTPRVIEKLAYVRRIARGA